jgi:hypothetical protein
VNSTRVGTDTPTVLIGKQVGSEWSRVPGKNGTVIKLADTALDTDSWTGDELALASVERAAVLIDAADP